MPSPTRPLPYVGMPVRIVHLGAIRESVVEEVQDGGRCLVVGGEQFTLRRLNGRFVRASEHYYGTRLSLRPSPSAG